VKPSRSEAVRLNSQERSSGFPQGLGAGGAIFWFWGGFCPGFSLLDTLGIKVGKKIPVFCF